MKNLHFLAGLPRSGSTVLTKLLNQHPEIFASSTSPFLDYLLPAAKQLHNIKESHSAGHYVNTKRILSTAAFAFYDTPKSHIIDKNRGWITNYEAIDKELQENPKIILTLRPIEEVVASFYKIINHVNNGNETPEQIFLGRVAEVYQELMRKSYLKDKIHIVTYKDLTTKTLQSVYNLETFLEIDEHHSYDINNIVDTDPEDDSKWGLQDLHKIRSKISNTALPPDSIMTKSELNFCRQLTQDLYNAYGVNQHNEVTIS
jgi:sulfotransferase